MQPNLILDIFSYVFIFVFLHNFKVDWRIHP